MANFLSAWAKRFMILPVAVLVANLVCAEDAQYQDVHYTVDDNRLTAEVTLNPKASGELLIPETIVVGQNTYTVIAIGDKAFKGETNKPTVTLEWADLRGVLAMLTDNVDDLNTAIELIEQLAK